MQALPCYGRSLLAMCRYCNASRRACSIIASVLWMLSSVTLLPAATLTGPLSNSRSSQHMKVVSLQPQIRMCCGMARPLRQPGDVLRFATEVPCKGGMMHPDIQRQAACSRFVEWTAASEIPLSFKDAGGSLERRCCA